MEAIYVKRSKLEILTNYSVGQQTS